MHDIHRSIYCVNCIFIILCLSVDEEPILGDLQHMECASIKFRLMERIQPYCEKLAIALGFPGHEIKVMVQKSDPVLHLLTEWLRGASGDPNKPITWRTLIEALRKAKMQQEVDILKKHFIFDSDTSPQPSELLLCIHNYTYHNT